MATQQPQVPPHVLQGLASRYPDLTQSTIASVVVGVGADHAASVLESLADPELPVIRAIMEAIPGVPQDRIRAELKKAKGNHEEAIMALLTTSVPPLAPAPVRAPAPAPVVVAPAPVKVPATAPSKPAPAVVAPAPVLSSSGKAPLDESVYESAVKAEQAAFESKKKAAAASSPSSSPSASQVVRKYDEGASKAEDRQQVLLQKERELTKEVQRLHTLLDEVSLDQTSKHKEDAKQLVSMAQQLEETRKLLIEAEVKRSVAEALAAQTSKNCVATITLHACEEDPTALEVKWSLQGVPPTYKDWVALFIHNREFKYETYIYTNGSSEGSRRFTKLQNGYYDARLFHSGSDVHLCRSEPALIGPKVEVKAFITPDRKILVNWTKAGLSSNGDWVGFYKKTTRSNKQYIAYCSTSDVVSFPVPRDPGVYEVRYFLKNSGYCFSGRSEDIVIPNTDAVVVDGVILETSDAPAMVKVHWSCQSKEPNPSHDWIGVFEKNASNRSYIACKYTSQGKIDDAKYSDSGSLDIELSGKARQSMKQGGEYEVRFFNHAVGKYTPLLTAAFTFP